MDEIERLKQTVFKKCALELTQLETEIESQAYCAHHFSLNGFNIKFRKAKITPTKTGQFVTLWKRDKNATTCPFDSNDPYDFYMIAVQRTDNLGLFIFPKHVLMQQHVLSDQANGKNGKRGFRVYPPWDLTTNKQAQKTQLWQKAYFLDHSTGKEINVQRMLTLLNMNG